MELPGVEEPAAQQGQGLAKATPLPAPVGDPGGQPFGVEHLGPGRPAQLPAAP